MGTEVAVGSPQMMELVAGKIATYFPNEQAKTRFLSIAKSALLQTSDIAQCEPTSVMRALTQAAELNLEFGAQRGLAYIVPFRDKGGGRAAQLIIGYRGLIELAGRAAPGCVVNGENVYANEHFHVDLGTNRRLEHTPDYFGDAGAYVGSYATIKFLNGVTDFEFMNAGEVEKIRSISKAKFGPWVDHESEMQRKCPIRRLLKRHRLGGALDRAMEIDNESTPLPTIETTARTPKRSTLKDRLGLAPVDETVVTTGFITDDQMICIGEWFDTLGMDEPARLGAIRDAGAKDGTINSLTSEQAEGLIRRLAGQAK